EIWPPTLKPTHIQKSSRCGWACFPRVEFRVRHRGTGESALATARARVSRHRPRRDATRGPVYAGARQHRHDVGLPACAPRELNRAEARSWGVPSMKATRIEKAVRRSA